MGELVKKRIRARKLVMALKPGRPPNEDLFSLIVMACITADEPSARKAAREITYSRHGLTENQEKAMIDRLRKYYGRNDGKGWAKTIANEREARRYMAEHGIKPKDISPEGIETEDGNILFCGTADQIRAMLKLRGL